MILLSFKSQCMDIQLVGSAMTNAPLKTTAYQIVHRTGMEHVLKVI